MNKKHLWIMLAGCLVPLAAILAVAVFKVPLGTVGIFALLLLCPLGHLLMMRGMGHKEHHQNAAASDKSTAEDAGKR